VDEMEVDVQERRLAGILAHDVGLPDLLEESTGHGTVISAVPSGPAGGPGALF
jgi:hypothetical protein